MVTRAPRVGGTGPDRPSGGARVTVLIEDGETYDTLRGVSCEGRAEIVEDPESLWQVGVNVWERYNGPYTEEMKPLVEFMLHKRVAVRIDVERTRSWDHRKLGMDPLELRLKNYAENSPTRNIPYTAKGLRQAYRMGAERIGWSTREARRAAPSKRPGPWKRGWGMASQIWGGGGGPPFPLSEQPFRRIPAARRLLMTIIRTAIV